MNLPDTTLLWDNNNVLENLKPWLIGISLTETIENGGKDELNIKLANKGKIFLNEWYPSEGARLKFFIQNYPCGEFSVDQLDFTINPPTIAIRAQPYQSIDRGRLTTKQSKAFENIKLDALIDAIIASTNHTAYVQCPDIHLDRFDMTNESVEQVLTRLADTYNCHFAVKGGTLVFSNSFNQGGTIHSDDCTGSFSSTARNVIAAAQMEYYDPKTQKTFQHREGDTGAVGDQVKVIFGIAANEEDAKNDVRQQSQKQTKTQLRPVSHSKGY
ncbi:MAG: late control gene D protein [Candidatus Magnetoglobus multicellularis str. Araruama]|uniref:Late control gene D protein n=1 Tax=Candidatus Magnetoglobus multicellularis str. Araruama TaxID=890399 RepID=A0A1V1NVR2_9BACT|nr:MAG: late control gene D protein [Candidatus Magnetoglobus multicellularis str. Araruama]